MISYMKKNYDVVELDQTDPRFTKTWDEILTNGDKLTICTKDGHRGSLNLKDLPQYYGSIKKTMYVRQIENDRYKVTFI